MERGIETTSTLGLHLFESQVPGLAKARRPQPATSPPGAANDARPATYAAKLDQRLTAVLQGLVNGFAVDAADFYLLNTASNELVLRANYLADEREPGATRRPLAQARADVAAMAGAAIVLEDDLEVADWPVPVWCGAAICLPVASDQTIHGTLWLYSSQPRTFADAEVGLAEVVAGRLAVELELDAWRRSAISNIESNTNELPATTSAPALTPRTLARVIKPESHPALEEWELAGCVTDEASTGAYYDWQTFADGRTLVAAGALSGTHTDPAATLQAARIALRAHAAESRDAGELLTRVNQTLWMASPGGEGLALAVALLDSDGAHASVALAGAAAALRWRASTCDALPAGRPAAGWSEQTVYVARRLDLLVRERVVLLTSPAAGLDADPLRKLARELQSRATADLRAMPGKRALRMVSEAAANEFKTGGLALARRR